LETADLILLNKIDLTDKAQIPLFLREIHKAIPDCQVIPTIRYCIDSETLWMASKPKSINLQPIHDFSRIATGHNYVTFSYIDKNALDETSFKKFVNDLPYEVFRMKGLIRFADRTESVNFVGGKSEWSPWNGEPETRLVFIGWDIEPKQILQHLPRCKGIQNY
jgi:G3E family GTPase